MSGHITGNLNFTATRNGWTRNFTLSPDQVSKIDYSMLESVLELQTIKGTRSSLRMFVEHPTDSGTFVKIRSWKSGEGTLQESLMLSFFADTMNNGTVMVIDVRDGIPDFVKQSGKAGDWLRAHGLAVTTSTGSQGANSVNGEAEVTEEGQTNGDKPQLTPSGFFNFFKPGPPTPSSPPQGQPEALAADAQDPSADNTKTEEDILRERGWQPILRRLTTKKKKVKTAKDIQEDGDGEEVEIPDGEEENIRPEKNAKWPKVPKFPKSPKKDKGKGKATEPADQENVPPVPETTTE